MSEFFDEGIVIEYGGTYYVLREFWNFHDEEYQYELEHAE